jgi:hypothetical protein
MLRITLAISMLVIAANTTADQAAGGSVQRNDQAAPILDDSALRQCHEKCLKELDSCSNACGNNQACQDKCFSAAKMCGAQC